MLTGLTFLSIHDFSDKADAIIERQVKKVADEASTYPPGRKELYDIQLELLQDRDVPDVELVTFPFLLQPDGTFLSNST